MGGVKCVNNQIQHIICSLTTKATSKEKATGEQNSKEWVYSSCLTQQRSSDSNFSVVRLKKCEKCVSTFSQFVSWGWVDTCLVRKTRIMLGHVWIGYRYFRNILLHVPICCFKIWAIAVYIKLLFFNSKCSATTQRHGFARIVWVKIYEI